MTPAEPTNFFESERLRLRLARPDDYPLLHRWWSDPEVAHYQVNDAVRLHSEEKNTDLFRRWMSDSDAGAGFVVEVREKQEMIGFCNLWGATLKNRSANYAIMLAKSYWNKGFGTEATRLMLEYAFRELNYHRVELTVIGFNDRAISAYKKAGFTEVGRRRQVIFRNGDWHDEVIMDVLQKEYLGKDDSDKNA